MKKKTLITVTFDRCKGSGVLSEDLKPDGKKKICPVCGNSFFPTPKRQLPKHKQSTK